MYAVLVAHPVANIAIAKDTAPTERIDFFIFVLLSLLLVVSPPGEG
jgi:hypothetical protein